MVNRVLDFFMSDRFYKSLAEPTPTKESTLPDPTIELKSEIDALKAELEAMKVPALIDPDPVPEPEPQPEPPIPFVADQEPATAPVAIGGGELEQFRRLAMRSDRGLGDYYKQNADAIRNQVKQLLEV